MFLRSAVGYFERLGVPIQRVLTDNGKAFRPGLFAATADLTPLVSSKELVDTSHLSLAKTV